jgi:hypothetical protein
MTKYVVSTLPIPQDVLNSKADGIALTIYLSNLITPTDYNYSFMADLCNVILNAASHNKKISLAVIAGNQCSSTVYNRFPFLEFTHQGHKGANPNSLKMKVPVFFSKDKNGVSYIDYFGSVIAELAKKLKEKPAVYANIDSIKVTGINSNSPELRVEATDFTYTDILDFAYSNAAWNWKRAGYDNILAKICTNDLSAKFSLAFPDKTLVLQYIPGLNGFPCISNMGLVIAPGKRQNITEQIINSNVFGINPCYTAFTDKTILPYNDRFAQLNQSIYEHCTKPVFDAAIANGEAAGIEQIEIWKDNTKYL